MGKGQSGQKGYQRYKEEVIKSWNGAHRGRTGARHSLYGRVKNMAEANYTLRLTLAEVMCIRMALLSQVKDMEGVINSLPDNQRAQPVSEYDTTKRLLVRIGND